VWGVGAPKHYGDEALAAARDAAHLTLAQYKTAS
jgi:hypothetical protein